MNVAPQGSKRMSAPRLKKSSTPPTAMTFDRAILSAARPTGSAAAKLAIPEVAANQPTAALVPVTSHKKVTYAGRRKKKIAASETNKNQPTFSCHALTVGHSFALASMFRSQV